MGDPATVAIVASTVATAAFTTVSQSDAQAQARSEQQKSLAEQQKKQDEAAAAALKAQQDADAATAAQSAAQNSSAAQAKRRNLVGSGRNSRAPGRAGTILTNFGGDSAPASGDSLGGKTILGA